MSWAASIQFGAINEPGYSSEGGQWSPTQPRFETKAEAESFAEHQQTVWNSVAATRVQMDLAAPITHKWRNGRLLTIDQADDYGGETIKDYPMKPLKGTK